MRLELKKKKETRRTMETGLMIVAMTTRKMMVLRFLRKMLPKSFRVVSSVLLLFELCFEIMLWVFLCTREKTMSASGELGSLILLVNAV